MSAMPEVHRDLPLFAIEFDSEQISALLKSAGISLDKLAAKIRTTSGNVKRVAQAEYAALFSATDELRDVESQILMGDD